MADGKLSNQLMELKESSMKPLRDSVQLALGIDFSLLLFNMNQVLNTVTHLMKTSKYQSKKNITFSSAWYAKPERCSSAIHGRVTARYKCGNVDCVGDKRALGRNLRSVDATEW